MGINTTTLVRVSTNERATFTIAEGSDRAIVKRTTTDETWMKLDEARGLIRILLTAGWVVS